MLSSSPSKIHEPLITGVSPATHDRRPAPENCETRGLGRSFPYGTLVVNVSGAAVLGVITGLALGHTEALLAGTATIGAYTTFSTWMFETQRLAEDRQVVALGANIVVSLLVGLVAAAVGRWLGGLW